MAFAQLTFSESLQDWRIYADFAQRLIGIARGLYVDEPFGVDLSNAAYALDSTMIDLCLSLFPWAPFRSTKATVKMHTLLDLHGNTASFIHISNGKLHDVNILDQLIPEAGACYIMERRYSHPVDRATGLILDQTLVVQGYQSAYSL